MLKAYPDPAIVLASDQKLCDLERFCCNLSDFCVFTVDPTFSFGDFDVTPKTYRHLLLSGKKSQATSDVGSSHDSLHKEFSNIFVSCIHTNQLKQELRRATHFWSRWREAFK